MEEKERYIIDRFDEDIFDIKKEYYPSNQTICDTLNQQYKRIKELESKHLLSESEYQNYCSFKHIEPEIRGCLDREKAFEKENQQLKQELKDERAELQQLYSHLEVEAFGEDIQEQAVKEIDKIKEENQQLKEELKKYKSYKTDDERIKDLTGLYEKYTTENQQLKQQLHDLPKKIVGEFKEKIKNIKENIWSHYGKHELINDVDYGKICELNKLLRILDTILKKYGEE